MVHTQSPWALMRKGSYEQTLSFASLVCHLSTVTSEILSLGLEMSYISIDCEMKAPWKW